MLPFAKTMSPIPPRESSPPVLPCVAVQRVRGVPDTASAGAAGDQTCEPGVGRNSPGGGVQGARAEASEGGVREHAEVHDLPV